MTSGRSIKCVVWDLDETLWSGTLLEDGEVVLRPGIREVLETLDRRGILHSIASRNSESDAMARLEEFGIADFFLYPQIHWNAKSSSVEAIAGDLALGLDAIAFVDDQAFEREEVAHVLPQVWTIPAAEALGLPDRPEMMPRFTTPESGMRRQMMRFEESRRGAEAEYVGPDEEFLASLGMKMEIRIAQEGDLQRAEELTVRTNQVNATGYTYSYDELDEFRTSPHHRLLVTSLTDRFGTYGTIGLALLRCPETVWRLHLLLMSCRVLSRGVGSALMGDIMARAREAGARLEAEFVPTERNRMMFVTYRFLGFRTIREEGEVKILEHPLETTPEFPSYIERIPPKADWLARSTPFEPRSSTR